MIGSVRFFALLLSFNISAQAAELPCDGPSFLRSLIVSAPEESAAGRSRLLKTSQSKIIDEAIATQDSVFEALYHRIGNYERDFKEQKISLSDESLELYATIQTTKKNDLIVKIHSVNIPEMMYGKNASGANRAFFKFLGSLFRGIEQNITSVPNGFKSVQVVGSTVVNKKLAVTLQELGFLEDRSFSARLMNSILGKSGYIKGITGKTGSLISYSKGDSLIMTLSKGPFIFGTVKKTATSAKYLTGKGAGKTWVLDVPLKPESL